MMQHVRRFPWILGLAALLPLCWRLVPAVTAVPGLPTERSARIGQFDVVEFEGWSAVRIPAGAERCALVLGNLSREHGARSLSLEVTTVRPGHASPMHPAPEPRLPLIWPRWVTPTMPALVPCLASQDTNLGCEEASPSSVPASGVDVSRMFSLHAGSTAPDDPAGYVSLRAWLACEGLKSRIYIDESVLKDPELRAACGSLCRVFDEETLPSIAGWLGGHIDVDGDGKLAIVITPWLSRLQGGRVKLRGCARSADFRPDMPAPFSNRADVLFLNSELPAPSAWRPLLAHEYAHAVCFSRRLYDRGEYRPRDDADDWINEGLAHLAEDRTENDGSNVAARLLAFQRTPERAPLVVADYHAAGLWRDDGCRGATYLFFRWSAERFGVSFLKGLLRSAGSGVRGVEQGSQVPFDRLFLEWSLALAAASEGRTEGATPSITANEGLVAPGPAWISIQPELGTRLSVGICGTACAFRRVDLPASKSDRWLILRGDPGVPWQASLRAERGADHCGR